MGASLADTPIRIRNRRLPALFVRNAGQFNPGARFLARTRAGDIWLTDTSVVVDSRIAGYALGVDHGRVAIVEEFVGACGCRARLSPSSPVCGRFHYLHGNDPAQWHTNVPAFRGIRYADVWPGIDVELRTTRDSVRQNFFVAPGADPAAIGLRFSGVEDAALSDDGLLTLTTALGVLSLTPPRVFQLIGGRRVQCDGVFTMSRDGVCGFRVAAYAAGAPVVIDPEFVYATYLGGNASEECSAIAVDRTGNTFVTGTTTSPDFPTNAGAVQPKSSTRWSPLDVFVAKLMPSGSALAYGTYLGGLGQDFGRAIAVDHSGCAYVTGTTNSVNFPTAAALQRENAGPFGQETDGDGFVCKLNPEGSRLVYGTFLGGSDEDRPTGIAVDSGGRATLCGETRSHNFPTAEAAQGTYPGAITSSFVTRLTPDGQALAFSTYLGGSGGADTAAAVAVDPAGAAYVAGSATSNDFPGTPGPMFADATTGFITKYGPDGVVAYSVRLPYPVTGVDVDDTGSAVVVGSAWDFNLPVVNAFQSERAGDPLALRDDAYVSKLNPAADQYVYSSYLGGSNTDRATGVALDRDGAAFVVGNTTSDDFPLAAALQDRRGGDVWDLFVSQVSPDGATLAFSTYLGGAEDDQAGGLAVDDRGDVYVGLTTKSPGLSRGTAFQPAMLNPVPPDGLLARIEVRERTDQLAIDQITPQSGGDSGQVTVVISGSGMAAGAAAELSTPHQPRIRARPTSTATDGRTLSATFELTGAAHATYDLIVTNPDGESAQATKAFEIVAGQPDGVSVDILGPARVRRDKPGTFSVIVDNRGNVDIRGVPIFLAGIPPNTKWTPRFTPALWPSRPGVPNGANQVPYHREKDGEISFALVLPLLAPGLTRSLSFDFAFPEFGPFELHAWTTRPWFQSPLSNLSVDCIAQASETATKFLIGQMEQDCLSEVSLALTQIMLDVGGIGPKLITGGQPVEVLTAGGIAWNAVQVAVACAEVFIPEAKLVDMALDVVDLAFDVRENVIPACFDDGGGRLFRGDVVAAVDPNDKFGYRGFGPQRYVARDEPLRYVVTFENLSTATAPAQQVVITDPLDRSLVDLGAVELGPITIGERQLVPPIGSATWSTELDLRPAQELIVRIEAGVEDENLTWRFQSIDPATGDPPTDPDAGFLPPNVTPPRGQGTVQFSVLPRQRRATGTAIANRASIVFDDNPPIETDAWTNTIDATAPRSRVRPLPDEQPARRFLVAWRATEADSGVADYTIYVAADDGPFEEWLAGTELTEAEFEGEPGTTYAFCIVARDRVGNLERKELMPEATTKVKKTPATFVLYRDSRRQLRWRLVAANGRIIADSGEGYDSVASARRAIEGVRRAAQDADVEEP